MGETLLQKAKKTSSTTKPIDKEELEVIIAYLNGEITVRQAVSVLKLRGVGNFSHRIGPVLRFGLINKLFAITKLYE